MVVLRFFYSRLSDVISQMNEVRAKNIFQKQPLDFLLITFQPNLIAKIFYVFINVLINAWS